MWQAFGLSPNNKNDGRSSNCSTSIVQDLEYYAIRLEAHQSVGLYGYMQAKKTLTWKDTLLHTGINLRSCCENGIDAEKLCRMQPNIREWMRNGKASLDDSVYMIPWKPDVFNDLGCSIGDLVVHRKNLGPELLIHGGVTFKMLREKYGLTAELMALLKYNSNDWVQLKVCHIFLKELTDEQWTRIFGSTLNRAEMIETAKRA